MNAISMKFTSFVVMLLVLVARAESPTDLEVRGLLDSCGNIDALRMMSARSGQSIPVLRDIADDETLTARQAVAALVNLGDTNTILRAVAALCETNSFHRQSEAYDVLRKWCLHQPLLIEALADPLMVDESTAPKLVHGEFLVEAPSVLAARLMRSILAQSESFDAKVKAWAVSRPQRANGESSADSMRREMRKWWTENQSAVEQAFYGAVKPLVDLPAALGPDDK